MARRPTVDAFATEVAQFAEQMTPEKARWEYALDRSTYPWRSPRTGQVTLQFNARTLPVVARFLGRTRLGAELRLRRMRDKGGYDGAVEYFKDSGLRFTMNMEVGPIEAWQIGHVYFVRLRDFPHVAKVGFSRRVRERLEDIESKAKQRLELHATCVGTLADEHWWHRDWRNLHISGEWFYWPKSSERSLPPFLIEEPAAA